MDDHPDHNGAEFTGRQSRDFDGEVKDWRSMEPRPGDTSVRELSEDELLRQCYVYDHDGLAEALLIPSLQFGIPLGRLGNELARVYKRDRRKKYAPDGWTLELLFDEHFKADRSTINKWRKAADLFDSEETPWSEIQAFWKGVNEKIYGADRFIRMAKIFALRVPGEKAADTLERLNGDAAEKRKTAAPRRDTASLRSRIADLERELATVRPQAEPKAEPEPQKWEVRWQDEQAYDQALVALRGDRNFDSVDDEHIQAALDQASRSEIFASQEAAEAFAKTIYDTAEAIYIACVLEDGSGDIEVYEFVPPKPEPKQHWQVRWQRCEDPEVEERSDPYDTKNEAEGAAIFYAEKAAPGSIRIAVMTDGVDAEVYKFTAALPFKVGDIVHHGGFKPYREPGTKGRGFHVEVGTRLEVMNVVVKDGWAIGECRWALKSGQWSKRTIMMTGKLK